MKKIVLIFILAISFSVCGQQIQWASKLIKYSSDLGGKQYGIKRILGKPDVFPQAGNSPNAWNPKNALDGYEIVEVGFEKPQSVKQIAVFENLNAGCVVKISVDTGDGKYKTVWARKRDYRTPTFKATIPADHAYYFKRKRRKIQEAPDVFNPGVEHAILESVVSNVVAVKVEFNFALLPGQKQVDAIGISDSEQPIDAEINVGSQFKNIVAEKFPTLDAFQVLSLVVAPGGEKILFTQQSEEKELVYSCQKETSRSWSIPKLEATLSENGTNNYVDFIKDDLIIKGGKVYQKASGETGYQFFNLENGNYQPKDQLMITAYANYSDAAFLTATTDLKTVVLAVESDFTQGGTDFYFTKRKEDGTFGLLQNMGKIINSADDDISPQLLSDGKTLLFSSNGFSGFGGYDVFVSYRLDDTWKNWSEPTNVGSGINSAGYDGAPFYDETNEMLYFVTDVDGKSAVHLARIPKQTLMNRK
jgi:WD40-like Beta Propeller Repeat